MINYNYTTQSTIDSLNFSSTTEEAAGDTTFSHTNNFNNVGYCTNFGNGGRATSDGHWDYVLGTYVVAVGSVRVRGLSVNYSSSLAEIINSNISRNLEIKIGFTTAEEGANDVRVRFKNILNPRLNLLISVLCISRVPQGDLVYLFHNHSAVDGSP